MNFESLQIKHHKWCQKNQTKGGIMFRKLSLLAAIAIWGVVPSLYAQQDQIRLGQPAYGGNGCPAGTASATVSPDQQSLSILFDQFASEAGGATRKRMDRKSCNLSIPVTVPQGYSVAVISVDYRGYLGIPSGAQSRFEAEYFWAGSRGPKISRAFYGPISDSFNVTDNLLATTQVWTPCGASVILRVNASMLAQTNRYNEQTLAIVDSADVDGRLIYQLQWRTCRY
jgi:hypothetical protein